MPIHLEPLDVSVALGGVDSVLIVSCPICPPLSVAMDAGSPFIDFFKSGFKTGAFEDYIKAIREPLERRGVRTGVYALYFPCPTMCLWTKGQRRRLAKRADGYEAVLVLGCSSAAQTVEQTLEDADCHVIKAMRATGITNATLRFRFPLTIDLEQISCSDKDDAVRET